MKKTTLFSLALAAGLALSPSLAGAQTKVTLTTAKTVGSEFTFVTNPGKVTVDWGDGKTVEVSTQGEAIKGELKGQTITISSNKLSFFDCSSNELTALNVEGGETLSTFFCSDNKLSALDLNSMRNLVHLDCSGNEVNYLGLTLLKNLETLNCADNKLTNLTLNYQANLKTLICANNDLSSLTVTSTSKLETLWCQGNSLKSLNLSSNGKLQSLVCDGNEIASLNISNCTGLVDFWCDNNKLESLNVQNNVKLQTLSCSNNMLSTLNIPAASLANKALAFYCDGNNLTFTSMHSLDNMVNSANMLYAPQGEFALPTNKIKVNEQLNLSDLEKNADNDVVSPSFIWKNGDVELEKGSSADYTARGYNFTFKKPFAAIHCEVTSTEYPGLTLTSEPLTVWSEETGIQDIMDAHGFSYVTNNGTITMRTEKPYRVNIYTLDGKQLWTGMVTNEERVTLGHGIFLVNGVKISL